jgi:hypothetical protein
MGIYSNHGIEFRIKKFNGDYVTLIPMSQLDKRLINSQYYKKRKLIWFVPETYYNEFCNKIKNDIVDVNLSEKETNMIYSVLANIDAVKEYGWYEVNYLYSTL